MEAEFFDAVLQAQTVDQKVPGRWWSTHSPTENSLVLNDAAVPAALKKSRHETSRPFGKLIIFALGECLAMGTDDRFAAYSLTGSGAEEYKAHENKDKDAKHQPGVFTERLKHVAIRSVVGSGLAGGRRSKAGKSSGSRGITRPECPGSGASEFQKYSWLGT